jgi:hypothetical protein
MQSSNMIFLCWCCVLRWIWCLWCYSECISTPDMSWLLLYQVDKISKCLNPCFETARPIRTPPSPSSFHRNFGGNTRFWVRQYILSIITSFGLGASLSWIVSQSLCVIY